jgi:hypothetical protein
MITIPKWVETATKEQVVAMAAKMADRLQDLQLAADEAWDCSKDGGCRNCRPDYESCELRKAGAALIEWDNGPGSNE